METSVKAAKVLVPPPPTESSEGEEAAPPAACASSPSADSFDPMEEFNRQLEDIISMYGSAASVLDKQSVVEAELEKMKKEAKEDVKVNIQSEVSLIMKSLNKLSSPEKKLEDLVRQCAELAAQRRVDEKKLCVLQQTMSLLLDERQQLQAERRSSCTARSKLETMCRELQGHYSKLRDQTLQRCREDEEKRKEMTGHFQSMLTEIQEQIEQHSSRNDKLCRENSSLTDKLESLMGQCELREESLEKINQRRDLQHKLTEAKLQQSNAQLAEAEEKHRREKEYLLREAIDKTKKCFAMKEQELAMKKKLTLYGQKFDEFQETLSKSNEIYVRFKNEMENMSEKMKKMEKESNLWKKRFENCNKALTDMIEERSEKNKEYEMFVLKIHKLEKLCQALQEERGVLYSKIKEVQQANANLPSKIFTSSPSEDVPVPESVGLLSPDELQELQQIQEEDPALTEDMTRLREQQAKLNEFAASLLATSSNNEQEDNKDSDTEEDAMASMFIQFTTKTKVKEQEAAEEKVEEEPKLAMLTPEAPTSVEDTAAKAEPEAETVETPINNKEVQPVKPDQQQPAELASTTELEKVELSQPTDTKPEAAEAEIKQAVVSVPVEPVKEQEEAPTGSEPAPPSENTPNTSNTESSKKQAPKKKKKKNTKNAS